MATTLQVPVLNVVTSYPFTVHTFGVTDENTTGKPLDAYAKRVFAYVNPGETKFRDEGKAMFEITCGIRVIVI